VVLRLAAAGASQAAAAASQVGPDAIRAAIYQVTGASELVDASTSAAVGQRTSSSYRAAAQVAAAGLAGRTRHPIQAAAGATSPRLPRLLMQTLRNPSLPPEP
jgi:hypothetical protein